MFQIFPEYIFIDVTYNLDVWNCGLWIICIISNNRNLQIIAFGFIDTESIQNNEWIVTTFSERNPDIKNTKFLIADDKF